MVKLFLTCALILGGTSVLLPDAQATQSTGMASYAHELPEDAYQITVYRVVNVGGSAWSTSRVSAYYSRSENCIFVNEGRRKNQPYTIHENRAYGQSNDGRSEYRYTAGDYFFNL